MPDNQTNGMKARYWPFDTTLFTLHRCSLRRVRPRLRSIPGAEVAPTEYVLGDFIACYD